MYLVLMLLRFISSFVPHREHHSNNWALMILNVAHAMHCAFQYLQLSDRIDWGSSFLPFHAEISRLMSVQVQRAYKCAIGQILLSLISHMPHRNKWQSKTSLAWPWLLKSSVLWAICQTYQNVEAQDISSTCSVPRSTGHIIDLKKVQGTIVYVGT